MRNNDSQVFSSKRTFSMVPKLQSIQSKSTQMKQNQLPQTSSTKKHLAHNDKKQPEMDETQKFLSQTKNRLDFSEKQLHEFHRKRQTYKSMKQNIQFSILSKQIKATKQKLKNKHFFGLKKQLNKKSSPNFRQSINQEDFQQKLKLMRKVLNEQQMIQFEEELEKKQKQINNQYKDNTELKNKLLKYYLNYQVISRFLDQVAKDTKKLSLKQQNIKLYYRMKDEMIGLLSNEQFFKSHIHQIQTSQQTRQKALLTKTIYQQQRFTKTLSKGKLNYSTNQKSLSQKIQELLQTSKNNIKEAFSNFNKPFLMYQIQLQFNKRYKEATLNQ